MEDDVGSIIKIHYEKLPPDVREVIFSVATEKHIQEVAEQHGLQGEQVVALENETMFILMGIEHPRDYIKNLARELEVEVVKARRIAQDVNARIFRSIRESLKKVHGIDGEKSSPAPHTAEQTKERKEVLPKEEKPAEDSTAPRATHDIQIKEQQREETAAETAPKEKDIVPENVPAENKQGESEYERTLREVEEHASSRGAQSEVSGVGEHAQEESQEASGATQPTSILEKRLRGAYTIPRQESEYTNDTERQSASSEADGEAVPAEEEPQKQRYTGGDPYREPIG